MAGAVLLQPCGWSQQVSGPKSNLVQGGGLKVVVIQGEGATNSIRNKTATLPVVEVRDDKDKPVSGAEVIFHLPAAGPGGAFHGWMRTQTARTDEQGRATASGFAPNGEEGRFNIKVTATLGTKTGGVVIGQSNVRGTSATARNSRRNLWIVLGVLAVGGIAGGVAATRNGSSTTTSTPVTITTSPVTVGVPR